jgi:hypothetical protein
MRNIRDVRHSGTPGRLFHHCHSVVQQHDLYSTSINSFSTVSAAVRLTELRTHSARSSPSTSILSPSSTLLRFVASQCKYCRLYLGAGFRATLSGGAANQRTSFVSGSRSKCLAGCPEMSSPLKTSKRRYSTYLSPQIASPYLRSFPTRQHPQPPLQLTCLPSSADHCPVAGCR